MKRTLRHWLAADEGQDLIEYVLLGATIALAGVVAMNTFATVINTVYTGWDAATQNIWEPQAPAATP